MPPGAGSRRSTRSTRRRRRRVLRGAAARAPRGRSRSAMGFCLLNNVAVTAARAPRPRRAGARRRLGRAPRQRHPGHLLRRRRVSLRVDARVAALPGHRAPRRDRRGRGRGRRPLNFPLPGGRDRRRRTSTRIDTVVAPLAERFAPDLGARLGRLRRPPGRSAHRPRPLGRRLRRPHRPGHGAGARPGRLVVFLEGGYDLDALRDSAAATVVDPARRRRCGPSPPRRAGPGRTVVHAPRASSGDGRWSRERTRDRPGRVSRSARAPRRAGPMPIATFRMLTEASEGRTSRCVGSRPDCCATPSSASASDVHIKVGSPPFVRIDGRLERIDHADGVAGRDRAHRVRDHAEAARRGVHRHAARPTSRTRCRASAASASTCSASAARSASCCGACRATSRRSRRSGCRPSSASSPSTSAASCSSPVRPARARRRRSAR